MWPGLITARPLWRITRARFVRGAVLLAPPVGEGETQYGHDARPGPGGGGGGTDSMSVGSDCGTSRLPILGFLTASDFACINYSCRLLQYLMNRSSKWEHMKQRLHLKHLIIEVCLCFDCNKDCIIVLLLQNKHYVASFEIGLGC